MSDVDGVTVPRDALEHLARRLHSIASVVGDHSGINEPHYEGRLEELAAMVESWI